MICSFGFLFYMVVTHRFSWTFPSVGLWFWFTFDIKYGWNSSILQNGVSITLKDVHGSLLKCPNKSVISKCAKLQQHQHSKC